MPYSNVPPELWDKMESCVAKVEAGGQDKQTAIAICYASIMGKEKAASAGYKLDAKLLAEVDKMTDKKETENAEKCCPAEVGNSVPYGIISFAQLDAMEMASEAAEHAYELTGAFQGIAANILADDMVSDKPAALQNLAVEYASRVADAMKPGAVMKETEQPETEATADKAGRRLNREKVGFLKTLRQKVAALKKEFDAFTGWADYDDGQPEDIDKAANEGGLTIWKEANGEYRWLAVYSNNYRDQDNPPEIISAASHQRFVKEVDARAYPMPELWHWHIPGTAWGRADWVGTDTRKGKDGKPVVFALAAGHILPGHEKEAEALADMGDIALSHGMPKRTIQRDPDDPSVIVAHQTIEISDLPRKAAANKLTIFEVLKELDMIPDDKKEYLRQVGVGDEKINEIEAALGKAVKAAEADGLAHKEETTDAPPSQTEAASAPVYVTRDEVAQAVAEVMKPIVEQIGVLAQAVTDITGQVKAVKEAEAERASLTPAASLGDMIMQSVIGKSAARVDGREALAKAAPVENKSASGPFFWQSEGWTK